MCCIVNYALIKAQCKNLNHLLDVYYTIDTLLSMIIQVHSMQSRILLSGVTSDMWTAKHHAAMNSFLMDTSRQIILIYVDEQNGLTTRSTSPTFEVKEIAYFARKDYGNISMENFVNVVQFGTVHGNYVDGLLRTMHDLYAPTFFENQCWPDSIL